MGKTQQAAAAAVDFELVVTAPFPGYEKGQIITDADTINELIDSEWQGHFVKKAPQPPEESAAS